METTGDCSIRGVAYEIFIELGWLTEARGIDYIHDPIFDFSRPPSSNPFTCGVPACQDVSPAFWYYKRHMKSVLQIHLLFSMQRNYNGLIKKKVSATWK